MGKPTDVYVTTVRSTGRGSDYYGKCERCHRDSSEILVAIRNRIWERDEGTRYLSPMGGGTYGHMDCLIQAYGTLTSAESFPRMGRGARVVSDSDFERLAAV